MLGEHGRSERTEVLAVLDLQVDELLRARLARVGKDAPVPERARADLGGPLEPPDEATFRAVYFLRMALGNVLSLTVGAFLAAAATNLGLRLVGKATYLRGALGGALLGTPVGALTAGSGPFMLLISSTNPEWAWTMIRRAFLVGGFMGLTDGFVAGLVIIYFIKRQHPA